MLTRAMCLQFNQKRECARRYVSNKLSRYQNLTNLDRERITQKVGMGPPSGKGTYNNLSCSGVPGAAQRTASRRFASAQESFTSSRSTPIHSAPLRRSVALSHKKSCTNYTFVLGLELMFLSYSTYSLLHLINQHVI